MASMPQLTAGDLVDQLRTLDRAVPVTVQIIRSPMLIEAPAVGVMPRLDGERVAGFVIVVKLE